MEALKELIPLLLAVSLGGLVLTVALNADRGDLVYVLRRPRLLARSILSVMIIPPIAAAILVSILPLEPAVKAALMLMAAAPVPPLVPGGEVGIGARKSYAYGLYAAMVLLTVVSVPLVFNIAAWMFGRDDSVAPITIALMVAKGVLAPLAVGLVIRQFAPAFAVRIAPILYKLSMLLVVLAFLPILITIWGPLVSLVGNGTLLAMTALVLVCLGAGHLLGGTEWVDRGSLAVASSVRHPAIAMSLASANFTDKHVQAGVLLFMLVGLVVGAVYKTWFKRVAAAKTAGA
jgi:BASS family bile acid:Na+ symporter